MLLEDAYSGALGRRIRAGIDLPQPCPDGRLSGGFLPSLWRSPSYLRMPCTLFFMSYRFRLFSCHIHSFSDFIFASRVPCSLYFVKSSSNPIILCFDTAFFPSKMHLQPLCHLLFVFITASLVHAGKFNHSMPIMKPKN